jgi:uncharacterized protein YdaU (DUF1376 family)
VKYPWMPLFWGDFLANTMHLSAQEAGAYLFLIAHAWEHDGEIPGDRVRLARIAHVRQDQWNKVWSELQKFFEIKAGGPSIDRPTDQWYTHQRVTAELHRLGKISNNRKAAAEQKHSNSKLRLVGAPSDAPISHSTSNRDSNLGELREAQHGTPGWRPRVDDDDVRSPPRAKSDNVLAPLPDKAGSC